MNKTRCVICGKELEYDGFCCPTMCDECNKKWLDSMGSVIYTQPIQEDCFIGSVKCLICGEHVPIKNSEQGLICKICSSCKQAVMKMRETTEHEDKGE